jgi:hypothetical protein
VFVIDCLENHFVKKKKINIFSTFNLKESLKHIVFSKIIYKTLKNL